jgi:hypothetical protein
MKGVHETVRKLRPKEMKKVGDEQKIAAPKGKTISIEGGQQEWRVQKTT